MADENAELMELLDRLKAMRPGAGEEAKAAVRPVQQAKQQATASQKPAKAEERPPAAQPKAAPKTGLARGKQPEAGKASGGDAVAGEGAKPGVVTGEIYQKIFELEQDILSKEKGIGADLRKLNELVEALGIRESEMSARESELTKKDKSLSKDLEDMKRIRAELQKILK